MIAAIAIVGTQFFMNPVDAEKFSQEKYQTLTAEIEKYPDAAITYIDRGEYLTEAEFKSYAETKKFLDQAYADFSKAIEKNPESSRAYSSRGKLAVKMVDLALKASNASEENKLIMRRLEILKVAMGDYNKAIELKPNDGGYRFNRAFLYRDLEMYDESIKDFSACIDLGYTLDGIIYVNRGTTYWLASNFSNAIEDCNTAIEIFTPVRAIPECKYWLGRAYFWKAKSHESLKEYDDAINDYNRAIENDSENKIAIWNCALLYEKKLKNYESALRYYSWYSSLDPADKDAQKAKQRMEKKLAKSK